MQTTLLGLAIAVILALITALVGPLFVDWDQYRTSFETEASRVVGVPVRVNGPIQVRLLPTPTLALSAIELGAAGDAKVVRAQKLGFEFALGALLRGRFRVAETRLVGPEFNVSLDRAGRVGWPAVSIGFDPDAVAIEHLSIEDGKVTLSDAASGARTVLDKLWFTGEVSSLAGPFKGEGAFINRGEPHAYRLAAGRLESDGGMHLHLGLDPSDRLTMDADGTLSWHDGTPRFAGSFSIGRPAGLARARGETLLNEPWRASTRVQATPEAALFEQTEFQYGSEERGFKLAGTAKLTFGDRPRFTGVLSGRQIDLDRTIAMPDVTGRPPFAALQAIAATFGGNLHPPVPIQIGLSVDALTLGGTTLQSVHGDVQVDGDSLNFGRLEFRAPGYAQVEASGRLDLMPSGIGAFAGPVTVDAGDPRAFAAWLEGRDDPGQSQIEKLHAHGEVTLAQDKLQVEHLKLEFENQAIEGRLAYLFAAGDRPARIDADLQAPELDIDQALAFAKTALAGSKLDRPQAIGLALAIGHATIAGIDLRQAEARLRIDGNGVAVDKLSVADLGGAAFQASGAIDAVPSSPRGRLSLDLDARSLAGVAAVLARFVPQAADPIRRLGDRLVPAKLHMTLSAEAASAAGQTLAKFGLDGRAGVFGVSIRGEGTGDVAGLSSAQIVLDGKIDADDGTALASITGADRLIVVDKRPAKLTLAAKGPLNGEMRVDSRVSAAGLDAAAGGTVRLLGEAAPAAALKLRIAGNASPLRRQSGHAEPFPLALSGQLAISPGAARLDDLSGKVGGATLRGHFGATSGQPVRIDGAIETDALDASAAIAAAAGLPNQGGSRSELALWSAEPFGPWLFSGVAGQVAIKAARATFTPTLVAQKAQATLRLNASEIAIDDISGVLAGGRITGQLTLRSSETGIAARGRIALSDADAAVLIPGERRAPILGRLGLQVEASGDGRSPVALIGSMIGGGTFSLDRAQLTGMNPKVFDTLARAVDQGTVLDTPRIRDIVGTAFDAGRLPVPRLEAAVTIAAGRGQVETTIVPAESAELAVSGNLDFAQGALDARLRVSGPAGPDASGERPDVTVSLSGPLATPKRTLDVSALAGWLTLRAVELQSRRLEAAEAKRRQAEEAETRRHEAEAAAAKRSEPVLSGSQESTATASATATAAESGKAALLEGEDTAAAAGRESTGTATAPQAAREPARPAAEGWSGTASTPGAALPPGLEPLPPAIDIKPAPAPSQHKPAVLDSAAELRPRPSTPPATKRPPAAAPLKLVSPSASP